MSLGARLRRIAEMIGGVNTLSRHWGMKTPGLYNYFNDKTRPGTDILLRMYDLGYSVEWLLTGNGDMFAANEAGRELRRVHTGIDVENIGDSVGERLKVFAELHLGSMDQLAEVLGKSTREVSSLCAGRKHLAVRDLQALAAKDCNLNWLIYGTGEMHQVSSYHSISDAPFGPKQEVLFKVTANRGKISVKQLKKSESSELQEPESKPKPATLVSSRRKAKAATTGRKVKAAAAAPSNSAAAPKRKKVRKKASRRK